jgi:hypothetical protein
MAFTISVKVSRVASLAQAAFHHRELAGLVDGFDLVAVADDAALGDVGAEAAAVDELAEAARSGELLEVRGGGAPTGGRLTWWATRRRRTAGAKSASPWATVRTASASVSWYPRPGALKVPRPSAQNIPISRMFSAGATGLEPATPA